MHILKEVHVNSHLIYSLKKNFSDPNKQCGIIIKTNKKIKEWYIQNHINLWNRTDKKQI